MCKCFECEMLCDDEPIAVVVYKSSSPFSNDIISFCDGYKCLYNGVESLNMSDLSKGRCRLRGE